MALYRAVFFFGHQAVTILKSLHPDPDLCSVQPCKLEPMHLQKIKQLVADTLVLPQPSYACEAWAVSSNVGEAAEVLHRGFLKQLLSVRISTTNQIVLAEFGRIPLQIHFWQQILRYHHRTVALDDTRHVELAMLSGCTLSDNQAITATADKT